MKIGIAIESSKGVTNLLDKLLHKIDDVCLKYFESKEYSQEQITSFYFTVNCFNPAISTFNPEEKPTGFYTIPRYIKKEKSFECGFHVNFTEVQQAKDESALLEIFIRGLKSIYPQLSKEKFKDFAFDSFWKDLMQFTEELPKLLSENVSPVSSLPEFAAIEKNTTETFKPQNWRSDSIRIKFQEFIAKPKFIKENGDVLYMGPSIPELLPQMTSLINKATNDFIQIIKDENTELAYYQKIKSGLADFASLMLNKTDLQRVYLYYKELMEIVGIQSNLDELIDTLSELPVIVTHSFPEYDPTLATEKNIPKAFSPQDPRSDGIRVKFQNFKSKPKFTKQMEGIMYPGAERPELLPKMTAFIHAATDDFIEVIKGANTETAYLEKIDIGLSRFDTLMLDTEDRQKVCMYFEELMDIVGLHSSNGKLNTWMYGFDPAKAEPFAKG